MLASSHLLLREGLRRLLEDEPDIEVVAEAGSAAECLRELSELRPDVLLADAATFGLAGAQIERLLTRESAHTKVVFLNPGAEHSKHLSHHSAASCVAQQTSAAELVEMVRNLFREATMADRPKMRPIHIASDRIASDRIASDRIASIHGQGFAPPRRPPTPIAPERALTAREHDVLKLLAQGKTVRATAAELGVSTKTVDAHKFNLMRKLGLHNKAELVMWAIQKKVVNIPANW
jgi:two-component system, NarL family, response regulator NreC